MSSQFYGTYTRLDPVLSIDGVDYGAAIKFSGNPHAPTEPGVLIVSGEVVSASTSGSTVTIKCAREFQTFSKTEVIGAGDSYERQYKCLMGGNIAQTMETERGYSWVGERSFRGGDALDRIQPGDLLKIGTGFYLVTSCAAFAQAPASVAWQGDDYLPTITTFEADINDVFLDWPDKSVNPDASVLFDPSDTGVFDDTDVLCEDEGSSPVTYTTLSRKIFNNPNSAAPDEYYYPSNATFSGDEYWFDPETYQLRIASGLDATGTDYLVSYYHTDLDQIVIGGDAYGTSVLEATGTGYDTAASGEDDLAVVSELQRGDFSRNWIVSKGGTNAFGTGSIEVRVQDDSAPASAAVLAFEWDGATVNAIRKRDTNGAAMTSLSYTDPGSLGTNFFTVTIARTGANFSITVTPEGGSPATLVSGVTLTDAPDGVAVQVGMATWDTIKVTLPGDAEKRPGFADGTLSQFVLSEPTGVAYEKEFTLGASEAITEVYNVSAGAAMSSSATPGRGNYSVSAGKITFYSEASGDLIRVTHAAAVGTPATPGEAPRLPGTTNMATDASSTVSENRAHYHDSVSVHDPNGELASLAPGTEFDAYRGPAFDSRTPPTLSHDVQNGSGDWATVASSNYLLRACERLFLLKESYVSGLGASDNHCWRASGIMIRANGAMHARQYNDLAHAIEVLDNAWIPLTISGQTYGVQGECWTPGFTPSGYACDGGFKYRTGFMGGHLKSAWHTEVDALVAAGASYPCWIRKAGVGPGWATYSHGSPMTFTTANNTITDCGSNTFAAHDAGTTTGRIWVRPAAAPGNNFFGTEFASSPPFVLSQTTFNFDGLGFDVPKEIAGLDENAEIVEAVALATFNGFQFYDCLEEWDYNEDTGNGENVVTINGVEVYKVTYSGGSPTIVTSIPYSAATSADISMRLMGRRIDTKNVYLPLEDDYEEIDDSSWRAFGASITLSGSSVSSGLAKSISIAQPLRALRDQRDSVYRDFQLWPGRAGVTVGDDVQSMTAYAESLLPTITIASQSRITADKWSYQYSIRWQRAVWTSATIANAAMRVRLGAGALDRRPLPATNPPFIQAP